MISNNIETYLKSVNENQLKNNDLLFSSFSFNSFNVDKVDYLYAHKTSKISMIFGVRGDKLSAPFTAPFGFIRYGSQDLKLKQVEEFYNALVEEINESPDISSASITLPAFFYNSSMITKNSLALSKAGFKLAYRDINSHIEINDHSISSLGSSTKKSIRVSSKYQNDFIKAESESEKELAYIIIKQNRESKGYPLRMTWKQVQSTSNNVANCDFFYTKTENENSAAAIVFHINNETVQVVYWGANEHGERHNAMYFLPFEIIEYYRSLGFKYIDVGPSSEQGKVSQGLNDFKQMIGCQNTFKESWVYEK
ncbi:TPA: peptidoglycan bridge formation glycyltransferase FemA/FemB family protein [Vibrio vulnificus]|nr:peptidoglycan bridge formation glycyltransferase FemA/FemB family protein [Vibrio vulnificus]